MRGATSAPHDGAMDPTATRTTNATDEGTGIVTAILGGFLIGVATQVLQGELDGSWNVLANSGVMWSLGAAAIGMLMPTARTAIAGGATSMVVASCSYYWAAEAFDGIASSGRSPMVWSVVGIVAGSAFGLAGWTIRFDASRRWLALAAVGGLLIGEGRHLVRVVEWLRPAGTVQLLLGVALVAVCVREDRRPLAVLGVALGGAVCYAIAVDVIDAVFMAPI
jgi:hypothetical protein